MKALTVSTSIVVFASLSWVGPAVAQADYNRADRMLAWNLDPLVSGGAVDPQWMADGDRFWYRNRTAQGFEFVLADPTRAARGPLFDHVRLAAAMSLANDTAYVHYKLPFETLEFVEGDRRIAFDVSDRRFECDLGVYTCAVGDTLPSRVPFVTSPDGRWQAFVHEHDLYVRPAGGGDSTRLTTDGEAYWAYGITMERPGQVIRGQPVRPVLQWSPDSRRVAVQRMDERNVAMMPLYSSTSSRPTSYLYPYAIPGDTIIPRFDIHIVDVEQGTNVRVDAEPQPYIVFGTTGVMDSTWITVKWSPDGETLYFTNGTRGSKRIQLMEAEASTGTTRVLVKDTTDTYIELNLDIRSKPNWAVVNGGEDIVWFSERDGWAHLYRYGPDGAIKNRITSGPWTVGSIVRIDEAADRIYFTARGTTPGQNPALQELYVVNLDGSGMRRLAGEPGDHRVRVTPTGRYFVDVYSSVVDPPVSVVRDMTGAVVMELERADVSRLEEIGWRPPEEFVVKARDGLTDIYGLLYRPADFDSTASYPIIENIYPGPFTGSVGSWTFAAGRRHDPQALAELGFVVAQIDHMGTPFRSKAFQDNYYGNMGDNGLPDHVAAIKQLAARYPYIDVRRVGIYGHSGGGFASTDAILRYPDFYTVAVSTAGNHDNRSYHAGWGEKYQGLLVRDTVQGTDNYANQVNASLAENLEGKLFLMHGDMDDNVHPSMTMQVVDALIKANKTFDLLLLPDRAHGLNEPYVIRRRWDYFVEHLLGEAPPRDFEIVRPEGS